MITQHKLQKKEQIVISWEHTTKKNIQMTQAGEHRVIMKTTLRNA